MPVLIEHVVDDGVVVAGVHVGDLHLEPLLLIQLEEGESIVLDVGVLDYLPA